MTFEELALSIRAYVEANRPIQQMLEWLKNGQGFCHVRFNDGEALCAFGLRPAHERNNCGHRYFSDLATNLQRMLTEIRDTWTNGNLRVMLGGYWYTQGSKISDLDEAAQALVAHCGATDEDVGWLNRLPWVGSDDIVRGLTTDYPYRIFDHLRTCGQPVYLICNPRNEPGRHMLGAKCLPISRIDCWMDTPRVMRVCDMLASVTPTAVFCWAAGMSKSWAWDTWRRHPGTTHLDVGHLLDAAFGEYSRAWTRRQDRSEPLWAAYEDRFIPYAKSFIPGGTK